MAEILVLCSNSEHEFVKLIGNVVFTLDEDGRRMQLHDVEDAINYCPWLSDEQLVALADIFEELKD